VDQESISAFGLRTRWLGWGLPSNGIREGPSKMRSFASLAVAVGAVLALASSSAVAAIRVPGTSATFVWTASTGSVKSYRVEVSRNRAVFRQEKTVSQPQVTISGIPGEKLSISVTALGFDGRYSASSQVSDTIVFLGSGSTDGRRTSGSSTSKSSASGSSTSKSSTSGTSTSKSSASKSSTSKSIASGSAPGDDWNGAYGSSSQPPQQRPLTERAMPYDFNGDGRTDLLWHNRQTNAAAVWLMNGTSPSRVIELGTLDDKSRFVGSGDFDGDGYADLLVRNSARGRSEIWFLVGDGVWSAVHFDDPGDGWTAGAIGDFDGDGYSDLLWRKGQKSLFWFMRGSSVEEAIVGPWVQEQLAADCAPELDGDGRSDLVWSSGEETVAWLMEGVSPWRSGPSGPPMEESLAIGCGDADGDRVGDVLWYDSESRSGTLWVMDGDIGMDRSFELPRLQTGWAIEASGDFDGDGLANEILLRNATSGRIEIWELRWNGSRTSFSVVSTERAGMGNGDWQVVAP
jgi:hypothetical protein